MKRTAIVVFVCISWVGLVSAQEPGDVIIPPTNLPTGNFNNNEAKPAKSAEASPGYTQYKAEARAREEYLLRLQTAEESVIRAAKARADQRTRRLESRRWFGISNQRPTVSTDPYNSDYAPHWVGNEPGLPNRWVGAGQPWSGTGE